MKIIIINVGNEVIEGDTLNSNAKYLSAKLRSLGHEISFHLVCKDDKDDLLYILNNFYKKTDLFILTGGLGPTKDDMTKEVVAEFLNTKLVYNDDIFQDIKNKFKKFDAKMTKNNHKQAYVLKDSIILKNEYGTAPGFIKENEKVKIVLLPGPPRELKPMFDKQVVNYLEGKNKKIFYDVVKISGVGESEIEYKIQDLINKEGLYMATYASVNEVRVKITSKVQRKVQKARKELINRFNKYIVSSSLEKTSKLVIDYLKDNDISISSAESCTGGLISAEIVSYPGVSKIYSGSLVTYSNEKKKKLLKVKDDTLKKFGAVSKEVVKEMLEGLQDIFKSDILIAVSGVAGPSGGTEKKPIGLVYIGIKLFENTYIYKENFYGDRTGIRQKTVKKVFNEIYNKLSISD
ncbi:MAG: competence/damage-inducible protein A [Bacillota bacterium]